MGMIPGGRRRHARLAHASGERGRPRHAAAAGGAGSAAGAPSRMAVPLAILGAAGRAAPGAQVPKRHVQMIAFLAQHEGGSCEAGRGPRRGLYDFAAGGYGPHSGLLDRDISECRGLVECETLSPFLAVDCYGSACRITEGGLACLARLGGGAAASAARKARECLADPPVSMLEGAYEAFRPALDLPRLEARARECLADALPTIRRAYDARWSRQGVLAVSMLERAEDALSSAAGAGGIQRRAIAFMSLEIAQRCADLGMGAVPPADHAALDPLIADAGDVMRDLTLYCVKKGILADPDDVRIDEVFGKEEARVLCEALQKAQISY